MCQYCRSLLNIMWNGYCAHNYFLHFILARFVCASLVETYIFFCGLLTFVCFMCANLNKMGVILVTQYMSVWHANRLMVASFILALESSLEGTDYSGHIPFFCISCAYHPFVISQLIASGRDVAACMLAVKFRYSNQREHWPVLLQ